MALPTRLELRGRLAGLEAADTRASVYAPALAERDPREAALLALLPVQDFNGALAQDLAARRFAVRAAPIAAVFCVDPFLRVADLAATLRTAGIKRVMNFPSVGALDGDTARTLAAVGYGPQAEITTLLRFREAGLSLVGCLATRSLAGAMREAGITPLYAPPDFGAARPIFTRVSS